MTMAIANSPPRFEAGAAPIRVMIVDDALVVRGLLSRWIEAENGLKLVASMCSGREAVEQLERTNPDVVILDVDMPDTDGIEALPQLLKIKRDLVVIMASTLTLRNAEISLRALALGAADYIPKPQATREFAASTAFRRELIDKIKALGSRRQRSAPPARVARDKSSVGKRAPRPTVSLPLAPQAHDTLALRPFALMPPRVLLVGASTGGPQALNRFFGQIKGIVDQSPVLVVQHMPPTFTTVFAEHIARAAGRPAH